MDNSSSPARLKMRVGDNEFEAEGTPECVREQFQAFQELVKTVCASSIERKTVDSSGPTSQRNDTMPTLDADLPKIMRLDNNRIVSLTARVEGVHDAVLIMLYGQKTLRNNEAVTGAELNDGLSATGGYSYGRLDRILDKLALDGDVTSFGERRGKKYRLTNTGIAKARILASDVIAKVA